MANMISNNNSNCKNTNNAVSGGGGGGVNNLRDICNFLQQPMMNPAALPPGASPYDHIIDMIRGLDLQDDGIVMNHKIKSIETDFCTIVRDENMLCESMEYMNDIALGDGDTALKFALLFSSRRFDALAMKDTKVRSAMLKILETNFLNADTYRIQDKDRLYNSITLLGEYYHRVRLADNSPITILGESLLGLLIREVSDLESIDVKLAKLILSQITLNGDIMRVRHKVELTLLLFHIRRNLIEQASLKPAVKALLLMTLDLYYSNFANLGQQLEEMYTKYLVLEDEDEGNNNLYAQQQQQQQQQQHEFAPQQYQQPQAAYQQSQHSAQQQYQQEPPNQQQSAQYNETPHIGHLENGDGERDANATNDAFEDVQPTTKKWSEQVCEDSLLENEFSNDFNGDSGLTVSGGDNSQQERLNSSYESQREKPHASTSNNRRYGDARDNGQRNSRRSYQTAHSPRPLKQNYQTNERKEESQRGPEYQTQSGGEERDETKPLPRWRAPRFNREPADQQQGYAQNQTRRFSISCDDDGQSVRSEGGSIRLYSVNDRLKHSQEKIANNNSNFNYIANSNWDRQSQRDDRSERSYISNYEMGNYRRRGGRGQYSRPTYDKPPRFQKHQQNKDNNKIHSDSWRRSQHAQHGQSGNTYQDENSSYPTGEPDSRSSSRARTLPRPAKSNWGEENANAPPAYRRSQSPSHSGHQYQRGPRPRQYNARYSSQSSLASEASSTLERRHNNQQRHRSYTRRPQQPQETHDRPDWQNADGGEQVPQKAPEDARDNNSELVRNAQQTTQYMNYLSSKK